MGEIQFRKVEVSIRTTGLMGEPFQFEADLRPSPGLLQVEKDRLEIYLKRYGNKVHSRTRVVIGFGLDHFVVGFYPRTVVTGVSSMLLDDIRSKYIAALVWAIKRATDGSCRFSDDMQVYLEDEKDPEKQH